MTSEPEFFYYYFGGQRPPKPARATFRRTKRYSGGKARRRAETALWRAKVEPERIEFCL